LLSYRADTSTGAAPFNRDANWDTDGDGMPDEWEQRHDLNPNVANNNADFDADGYTDLEEYLNEVAAWPAPGPIVFNGANSRYAEILNWNVLGIDVAIQGKGVVTTSSHWQPSRYDVAIISSGTVVVDAVGQHAGMLLVADETGGGNPTLNITAGWLEAADAVLVGGAAAGQGALHLSGGKLVTSFLGRGPEGDFQFTGGTLAAEVVAFDLVNNGGTIAPGASPGNTHVMGDLVMQSGDIEIELFGTAGGEYDTLIVDGGLLAGGTLRVVLGGSFQPLVGDIFDLFDFTAAGGNFLLDLPDLSSSLTWDTSELLVSGELSVVEADADFDGDGDVDGRDLLTWLRNFGVNTVGDATGDGTVDADDLRAWESQFAAAGGSLSSLVPEPSSCLLAGLGMLTIGFSRFRRQL
jgi:hypothetical protein